MSANISSGYLDENISSLYTKIRKKGTYILIYVRRGFYVFKTEKVKQPRVGNFIVIHYIYIVSRLNGQDDWAQ